MQIMCMNATHTTSWHRPCTHSYRVHTVASGVEKCLHPTDAFGRHLKTIGKSRHAAHMAGQQCTATFLCWAKGCRMGIPPNRGLGAGRNAAVQSDIMSDRGPLSNAGEVYRALPPNVWSSHSIREATPQFISRHGGFSQLRFDPEGCSIVSSVVERGGGGGIPLR